MRRTAAIWASKLCASATSFSLCLLDTAFSCANPQDRFDASVDASVDVTDAPKNWVPKYLR